MGKTATKTNRNIIKIDEEKCDGCGLCVTSCAEGALTVIDGKARLVSDVYCDGLGACLGECPEGALSIEERDAAAFDEKQVQEHLAKTSGKPIAHSSPVMPQQGCPGSAHMALERKDAAGASAAPGAAQSSELTHWPVQLHLVNPAADFFRGQDVVLAADCVAYALGDFHQRFLRGKSLAIACPKLDEGQDEYVEKIRRLADEARINTLTVVIMQVPCCRGLMQTVQAGLQKAKRKVPLKAVIVGIRGEILSEEWVN